jgi:hypothetical protein
MKVWDLPPPSSLRPTTPEADAERAELRRLGSGRYSMALTPVPDGPAPSPAPK